MARFKSSRLCSALPSFHPDRMPPKNALAALPGEAGLPSGGDRVSASANACFRSNRPLALSFQPEKLPVGLLRRGVGGSRAGAGDGMGLFFDAAGGEEEWAVPSAAAEAVSARATRSP